MIKGKLFVVEGACDGIGKTTQYTLLRERLEKNGQIVSSHHFPSYNTYHGTPVEKYLAGEFGQPSELSPYFINGLYANDRAITWLTKLKEKYDNGQIVLLDRYTTSSLIYQSALIENELEKKQFIDYVIDFEYNKLKIQKPDNVIFLHAPFDLVTEMRNARKSNEGLTNDIHESNLDFMKKVYESAVFVSNYLSWDRIECSRNNEMKSIEEIHEEVYCLVKNKS